MRLFCGAADSEGLLVMTFTIAVQRKFRTGKRRREFNELAYGRLNSSAACFACHGLLAALAVPRQRVR